MQVADALSSPFKESSYEYTHMQSYTTEKAALREIRARMSILPERLLYSQAACHMQTADAFEGSGLLARQPFWKAQMCPFL